MIYKFFEAVTQQHRYQILLKDSTFFKNQYGSNWYTLCLKDAEYQLQLLRKRGLV